MAAQVLTIEDLQLFKIELFRELHQMLQQKSRTEPRKWIKSYEVREMLGISPGTLQNMRVNGTIAYTKMGGLVFYDHEDIIKLMEADKRPAKPQKRY
jgi:hypothetical protein